MMLVNGHWQEGDQISLGVQDPALAFGAGLFETLCSLPGGRIWGLDWHLERFFASCQALGLVCPFGPSQLEQQLAQVLANAGPHPLRIKWLLLGANLIWQSFPLAPDPSLAQGVRLTLAQAQRAPAEHKSTSYAAAWAAWNQAQQKGFYDALLYGPGGITEASRSNLFWFEGQQLCTTGQGMLPGVTRRLLLEGSPFAIQIKSLALKDVHLVADLFLTNSVIGVLPVLGLDQHNYCTSPTPRQLRVMAWYQEFIQQEAKAPSKLPMVKEER